MNEVPIFILNAQTWKQEASFNIPSYGPTPAQLTWSPDSSHLAAAGANRVAIFSLSTQAITLSYPSDSTVSQPSNVVAWSPGDNIIASAAADDGHSLQFWNAITGEPLYYFLGAKPDVAVWSPEGKTIATGNTFAQPPQILASDTARVILNFQDKLPSFGKPQLIGNYLWQYPHTISWSPDGKYIAVATDQHKVQIWDVANKGLIYTYGEHTNWISAVAWSPDGTRVASSSYDKTVRVWQAL